MDPIAQVAELIDAFFSLSNPSVSDLEDLVVAINNVIDQFDLTPMQVREINQMIRSVSITYTIGEIETEDDLFGNFDYTEWDYTENDSEEETYFDFDYNDESSSIDPLSDEDDDDDDDDDEDDEFNWDDFEEDE